MNRHLAIPLHRAMHASAVVALTGPRRAGKATLARREFPAHTYVHLANTADRLAARENPAAFLASLRGRAIIDDAHRAPELLAVLATGQGSSLLLLAPIRLPLAHQLHLFPPSLAEREQRPAPSLEALARYPQLRQALPALRVESPGAQATRDEASLELDARMLIGLHDADRFLRFVEIAGAATGSVADQSAWARQCRVTHTTISRWLDALERAFYLIQPRAFDDASGRRLVKRRKVHFLDPAWVPAGARFATWALAEIVKNLAHAGQPLHFSHWLTATGLGTSLIVEGAAGPISVTITRLPSAPPAAVAAAAKWCALAPHHAACIVTAGQVSAVRQKIVTLPWWAL